MFYNGDGFGYMQYSNCDNEYKKVSSIAGGDSFVTQSDRSYFRVLASIEHILNLSLPGHKFSNYKGVPVRYFIVDLSDTTNVGKEIPDDNNDFVRFVDGHFYHVVPSLRYISYSFIIYFDHQIRKVFSRVNCGKKDNTITDVLAFAKKKLHGHDDEKTVLERIINYRTSIRFPIAMDNYEASEPKCE